MARGKVTGRPNKPTTADMEYERRTSDTASRNFTSPSRGTSFEQPTPRKAGHSASSTNPWKYAKGGKMRHAGKLP